MIQTKLFYERSQGSILHFLTRSTQGPSKFVIHRSLRKSAGFQSKLYEYPKSQQVPPDHITKLAGPENSQVGIGNKINPWD